MYAVGVGSGADRAELEEIASGSEYVYTSTSFEDLNNIAPGIRKRLCEGNVCIVQDCSGIHFVEDLILIINATLPVEHWVN